MWRIPNDICSVVGANGMVWVLPVRVGQIHGLDPVAETIWMATDGMTSIQDVLNRLETLTSWDREQITPHVEALVDQLTAYGLLEKVSPA